MKKSLLQTLFVTAILSGMNGVVSAGGGARYLETR